VPVIGVCLELHQAPCDVAYASFGAKSVLWISSVHSKNEIDLSIMDIKENESAQQLTISYRY